jgi:7-cyano-7-deazaguanine synthase
MSTKDKALVCLSGGMDSATLLGVWHREEYEVQAISFTYGSKHGNWEMYAARNLALHYKVRWSLIDLKNVFAEMKSSLLMAGGPIPEGHYTDPTMSQTVVPGRNMIFASILAGIAWSRGIPTIGLGVHSGDHPIYPDCRPAFVDAVCNAIAYATDDNVILEAPFLGLDKAEILNLGRQVEVPYELTRTCYKDQAVACGVCGSCRERLEAFARNGLEDPLPYEAQSPPISGPAAPDPTGSTP